MIQLSTARFNKTLCITEHFVVFNKNLLNLPELHITVNTLELYSVHKMFTFNFSLITLYNCRTLPSSDSGHLIWTQWKIIPIWFTHIAYPCLCTYLTGFAHLQHLFLNYC